MRTPLLRFLAGASAAIAVSVGVGVGLGVGPAQAVAPSTVCDTLADHPQEVIAGLPTRLQTRCVTNANRAPVMQAEHGTARVVAGGWVEYTPDAGYRGPDTLVAILAVDGVLTRFRDFFTVEVIGNAVATGESYAVEAGQPLVVGADEGLLANDLLPTEGWLIQQGTTPPAHGTITLDTATGAFTYVPDEGFAGHDRFLYRLTGPDDGSYSNAVEVSFTTD